MIQDNMDVDDVEQPLQQQQQQLPIISITNTNEIVIII